MGSPPKRLRTESPDGPGGFSRSDIAVIGIAGRFPGRGENPELLWKMLQAGESAWTEIPTRRFNINGFYHPNPSRQGSISVRGGHFLPGDGSNFDPSFFGISPAEAEAVDPQQRLVLEVVNEALENAGIPKDRVGGTRTAVFIGPFVNDYEQIVLRDMDNTPQHAATGTANTLLSNRVSFWLNAKGPSMSTETGCSSSLLTVLQACECLAGDEMVPIAIAGGVGYILTPDSMIPMNDLGFLSPDGKCHTFCKEACGYGRGEGAGVVVLKRVADAVRDRDTIRGVIRGWSTNQDGRTPEGITVPSVESQIDNIRMAYNRAGLEPDKTKYVECHGTGTQAGDKRELRAIGEAIAKHRDRPLLVGSLKTNIGHLEGAAGVAGLIKAVLVLEKGLIPKHLNMKEPNPDIKWKEWKVKVPEDCLPWPDGGLRRVSVNCFGFGGSNVHLIVDDAKSYLSSKADSKVAHHHVITPAHQQNGYSRAPNVAGFIASWHTVEESAKETTNNLLLPIPQQSRSVSESWISRLLGQNPDAALFEPKRGRDSGPKLFVFSSHYSNGVHRSIADHASHLKHTTESEEGWMEDYAYTLFFRRSWYDYRAFVVEEDRQKLVDRLEAVGEEISRNTAIRSTTRQPKIGFIFCGQGTSRGLDGSKLLQWRPIRESIRSAKIGLMSMTKSTDLEQLGASHPAIDQVVATVLQVALVDLLRDCGIKPVAVVGHSSGEIAAAYAKGAIDHRTALLLAHHRGQAAANAIPLNGGMIAVDISSDAAKRVLQDWKEHFNSGCLAIACENSPSLVTLSGDRTRLDELSDVLMQENNALQNTGKNQIFFRNLKVPVAYHNYEHMERPAQNYFTSIQHLQPSEGDENVRMFSSVTGSEVRGTDLDPSYWAENMDQKVEFAKAVSAVMAQEPGTRPDVLIEVSPRDVLRLAVENIISSHRLEQSIQYVPLLKRNDEDGTKSILEALGELWVRGVDIDLKWMLPTELELALIRDVRFPKCLVDLPRCPYNSEKKYWHESYQSRTRRNRKHGRQDLIGAPADDWNPHRPQWHGYFRVSENPWIKDHRIQNMVFYPAAGMATMAIQGAVQLVEDHDAVTAYEVRNLEIKNPMIIPMTRYGLKHVLYAKPLKTHVPGHGDSSEYEFDIHSMLKGGEYRENATGIVKVHYGDAGRSPSTGHIELPLDVSGVRDPRHLYERLEALGLGYGPVFRVIETLGKVQSDPDGRFKFLESSIKIPDTRAKMPSEYEFEYLIHPATLDGMFQTLFGMGGGAMLPYSIDSIFVRADFKSVPGTVLHGLSTATSDGSGKAVADITFGDGNSGSAMVKISGLKVKGLPSKAESGTLSNHRHLCSEIAWCEDISHHIRDRDWYTSLALMAHKLPNMEILYVGHGNLWRDTIDFLIKWAGDDAVPFSRFTFTYDRMDAFQEASSDRYFERVRMLLDFRYLDDPVLKGRKYDVVIRDSTDENCYPTINNQLRDGRVLYYAPGSSQIAIYHPAVHLSWANRRATVVFVQPQRAHLLNFTGMNIYDETSVLADNLADLLSQAGFQCVFISLEGLNSWAAATSLIEEDVHIISLLGLGEAMDSLWSLRSTDTGMHDNFFSQFQNLLLATQVKSIFWVSRGAQMECPNPERASFLGLARTLRSERAETNITCVDLDPRANLTDDRVLELVHTIFQESISTHGKAMIRDVEYAIRDGKVFVPRLKPLTNLNQDIENGHPGAWTATDATKASLDPNAAYLIVGPSGLGQSIAKLMVERGAKNLVFMCRNSPSMPPYINRHRDFFEFLDRAGVYYEIFQTDISDPSLLEKTMREIQAPGMPTIKGAIQAAAVISDHMFQDMTADDWDTVVEPKARGSSLLHQYLPRDMDFFILLSSAAGVIGNRAQANYAAANCYLDALARFRAASTAYPGRNCSIDLGPVVGTGMLANKGEVLNMLKANGFILLNIEHVLYLVERAMVDPFLPAQIVTGVGTGGLIAQNKPIDPFWIKSPLFACLNQLDLPIRSYDTTADGEQPKDFKTLLKEASTEETVQKIVLDALVDVLSRTSGCPAGEIVVSRPLSSYGIDSMMSLNLQAGITSTIGITIGILHSETSIEAHAKMIAGRVRADT